MGPLRVWVVPRSHVNNIGIDGSTKGVGGAQEPC